MTEQEAQQAQTIEIIKKAHEDDSEYMQDGGSQYTDLDHERMYDNRATLIRIVDSQAQKITKQAKEIARLTEYLDSLGDDFIP